VLFGGGVFHGVGSREFFAPVILCVFGLVCYIGGCEESTMFDTFIQALIDPAVLPPVACAGILLAIKLYSDRLHRKESKSDRPA